MLHAKEARTLGTQYEPPNELVQCMKKIRVTASRGVNFKCFNYELSEITLTKLTEFGYYENGVLVKPYIVPTADNIHLWIKPRGDENE